MPTTLPALLALVAWSALSHASKPYRVHLPEQRHLLPPRHDPVAICTFTKVLRPIEWLLVINSRSPGSTRRPRRVACAPYSHWCGPLLHVRLRPCATVTWSSHHSLPRYDNNSTSPMRNVLEPWIQSRYVTYLSVEHAPDEAPPQVPVFDECLQTFGVRYVAMAVAFGNTQTHTDTSGWRLSMLTSMMVFFHLMCTDIT